MNKRYTGRLRNRGWSYFLRGEAAILIALPIAIDPATARVGDQTAGMILASGEVRQIDEV